MSLDQIGKLQQYLLTLIRLELAPRPFKGFASGRNCTVDVFGITLRDCREQFTGCRISAFEALARRGIDPFAADQHLLEGAVCVGMTGKRNRLCRGHLLKSP
jgi:hypothetical protein